MASLRAFLKKPEDFTVAEGSVYVSYAIYRLKTYTRRKNEWCNDYRKIYLAGLRKNLNILSMMPKKVKVVVIFDRSYMSEEEVGLFWEVVEERPGQILRETGRLHVVEKRLEDFIDHLERFKPCMKKNWATGLRKRVSYTRQMVGGFVRALPALWLEGQATLLTRDTDSVISEVDLKTMTKDWEEAEALRAQGKRGFFSSYSEHKMVGRPMGGGLGIFNVRLYPADFIIAANMEYYNDDKTFLDEDAITVLLHEAIMPCRVPVYIRVARMAYNADYFLYDARRHTYTAGKSYTAGDPGSPTPVGRTPHYSSGGFVDKNGATLLWKQVVSPMCTNTKPKAKWTR